MEKLLINEGGMTIKFKRLKSTPFEKKDVKSSNKGKNNGENYNHILVRISYARTYRETFEQAQRIIIKNTYIQALKELEEIERPKVKRLFGFSLGYAPRRYLSS